MSNKPKSQTKLRSPHKSAGRNRIGLTIMPSMEKDLRKLAKCETEGNVSLLVRKMVQEGLDARRAPKPA